MTDFTVEEYVDRQEAMNRAYFVVLRGLTAELANLTDDPKDWLKQMLDTLDDLESARPADGVDDSDWAQGQEIARSVVGALFDASTGLYEDGR